LSLTTPEIIALVEGMEKETRAREKELLKLCWYMRGGVTLDEMYNSDNSQRELMSELIKENLETTKETRLPFF
jgi:hypothetical protein